MVQKRLNQTGLIAAIAAFALMLLALTALPTPVSALNISGLSLYSSLSNGFSIDTYNNFVNGPLLPTDKFSVGQNVLISVSGVITTGSGRIVYLVLPTVNVIDPVGTSHSINFKPMWPNCNRNYYTQTCLFSGGSNFAETSLLGTYTINFEADVTIGYAGQTSAPPQIKHYSVTKTFMVV